MILSDCTSPFYSNVYYLSVSKEVVKGAQIEKISGIFLAKVFEGEYRDIGKWVDEMKDIVKEKREDNTAADNNDLKMYFYYPTCPKCSKVYGKNYVVILARIGESEE